MDKKDLQLRDVTKQGWSAVFTLTLDKAGEASTSRTLTIDYIKVAESAPERDNVASFRALLLGKFNKFLQPSGWRDNDVAEDAWTTTAVTVKTVYKFENELDFS